MMLITVPVMPSVLLLFWVAAACIELMFKRIMSGDKYPVSCAFQTLVRVSHKHGLGFPKFTTFYLSTKKLICYFLSTGFYEVSTVALPHNCLFDYLDKVLHWHADHSVQ